MDEAVHVVYFHGFASSAGSAKAAMLHQAMGERAASFTVPELDGGDFPNLTMDRWLDRAADAVAMAADDDRPVLVMGSSLGGYTAALLAAERRIPRAGALLLIAPAFGFTDHWAGLLGADGIAQWRRDGSRPFYHYGAERELPLTSAFLESCEHLPAIPAAASCPTTIVHGRRDASVDWRHSLAYAAPAAHVDLHLVDDEHALDTPRSSALLIWCADELASRLVASAAPR